MRLAATATIILSSSLAVFGCHKTEPSEDAVDESEPPIKLEPEPDPDEPVVPQPTGDTKARGFALALAERHPELLEFATQAEREQWVRAHAVHDEWVAHLLGAYAFTLTQSGEPELALAYTDLKLLAAETFQEDADTREPGDAIREDLLAAAHYSKGHAYSSAGDAQRALEQHQLALQYARKSKLRRAELGLEPQSRFNVLFVGNLEFDHLSAISDDYYHLGDYGNARAHARLAYLAIRDSEDLRDFANARMYEASELERERGPEAAMTMLEDAARVVFEDKLSTSIYSITGPLDSMVGLYRRAAHNAFEARNFERARANIEAAMQYDRTQQRHLSLAEDLAMAALFDIENGDIERARAELDEIPQLVPVDQFTPDMRYLYHSVEGKLLLRRYQRDHQLADLHASAGQLEAAISVREQAGRHSDFNRRLSLGFDPSDDVIRVHHALFTAGQTASAIVALQHAEFETGQFELYARESNLDAWLPLLPFTYAVEFESLFAQIEEQLSDLESSEPDVRKQAMTSMDALRQKMQELRMRTKAEYPRVGNILMSGPLDVRGVHAYLEDGDALVRYYRTDTELFTWVVTKDSLAWTRTEVSSDEFESLIDLAQRSVMSLLPIEESVRLRLSQTLLGPLAGITGSVERLLVVPHLSVGYVPFDVLALPSADGSADPDRMLVEAWSVVHAPSISTWLMARIETREQRVGPPRFLGLADSVVSVAQLGLDDDEVRSLAALPAARREVESLAEAFGDDDARVLIGAEAQEATLRSLVLTDYDFLHFAVHGAVVEEQPALLLSAGGEHDGVLWLSEIFGLRMSPHLTVLSACESDVGRYRRRSGVLSLAKGFLVAGSDNVMATRWPIDDATTVSLMQRVYAELNGGARPSVALQRAKLWLMRQPIDEEMRRRGMAGGFPSRVGPSVEAPRRGRLIANYPYFWAGFSLYGADMPVVFVAPQDHAVLGSEYNPIKTYSPSGQREYIERLRCTDGQAPSYERVGNIGTGVFGHVVDRYRLRCDAVTHDLYMDMYFPGQRERRPIPGFVMSEWQP